MRRAVACTPAAPPLTAGDPKAAGRPFRFPRGSLRRRRAARRRPGRAFSGTTRARERRRPCLCRARRRARYRGRSRRASRERRGRSRRGESSLFDRSATKSLSNRRARPCLDASLYRMSGLQTLGLARHVRGQQRAVDARAPFASTATSTCLPSARARSAGSAGSRLGLGEAFDKDCRISCSPVATAARRPRTGWVSRKARDARRSCAVIRADARRAARSRESSTRMVHSGGALARSEKTKAAAWRRESDTRRHAKTSQSPHFSRGERKKSWLSKATTTSSSRSRAHIAAPGASRGVLCGKREIEVLVCG